jgi:Rab GDP dissociation inhibitor
VEQDLSSASSQDCSLRKVNQSFISGKRVLHIDRNPFYGGEGASVNLTNLWKIFREKEEPNKELGHNRDWNIDLIPKYIMYGGKLVKILLKTRVSKYL